MGETITVPRKARLAAYITGTIGSDAMAVLAGLSMVMGYAQAKWFLALSIAWHIVQGQLSQLASNNVPTNSTTNSTTDSAPGTDPAPVDPSTVKPAPDDSGNGDLPENVKLLHPTEGN